MRTAYVLLAFVLNAACASGPTGKISLSDERARDSVRHMQDEFNRLTADAG